MGKSKFFTFLIAAFVGILIIFQLRSQTDYKKVVSAETTQDLAMEAALISKNNNDLRNYSVELNKKYIEFQNSNNEEGKSENLLNEEIAKYSVLSGMTEIKEQGVEITIKNEINLAQFIDLINNLKNIGVSGISVYDNRLVISSGFKMDKDQLKIKNSFNDKELSVKLPFLIKATGDKNLIFDSVKRKGGIEEQLKGYSVNLNIEKKDNITLPKFE